MNNVNKTLYIPLYGKSIVSKKGIILNDPKAEEIWASEGFELKGKSKSKWLAYNMAMRARVFDDWTSSMLAAYKDAVVLHVGCGLDSRCLRVNLPYRTWVDCDFPDVLDVRRQYYQESECYHMQSLDASSADQVDVLPDGTCAIVVLEGISMYLTNDELHQFLCSLKSKYGRIHVLMDVYTVFGAKSTRLKNPINDVGVTSVYGVDDIAGLLDGTGVALKAEHSFTPSELVDEIAPSERWFFKLMFTGRMYRKIYRLYELEG